MAVIASGNSAVVLAALSWSTIGWATSFLPAGTDAASIAAARLAGSAVLFLLICRRWRDLTRLVTTGRCRGPVLLAGVAIVAHYLLYLTALTRAGVAVGAMTCMGSVPVFTGVLAALTHRRRPALAWLLAAGLAVGGCAAIAADGADPGRRGTLLVGVACALGGGLAYAVFTTACATAIGRGSDSTVVMAAVFGLAAALTSPVLLAGRHAWLWTPIGLAVAVYLVVVPTVGAYLLYGRGLRTTPAATAATLVLAEPAGAVLVGILVLQEPRTPSTITGMALIAGALLLARK